MSGKDARIFVGNLPPDIRTKDIEDLFHKFGKIVYLELKNRRGPPFAFLEYEDARYSTFQQNVLKKKIKLKRLFSTKYHSALYIEMPTTLFTPEMVTTLMGTS